MDIKFNCDTSIYFAYARITKDKRAGIVIEDLRLRHESWGIHRYMWTLVHELGHAFGMGDTYVSHNRPPKTSGKSRGGLTETIGIQPASNMSFRYRKHAAKDKNTQRKKLRKEYLTEDDKKGIVWLYKVFYEDLPLTDPYFSDYIFEEDTSGFRPKYPLLFEIKQGFQEYAIEIIKDDPNMDINVRDESGRTALDYAIIDEYLTVLYTLLSRPDLKVNAKNTGGTHSPASCGHS